VDPLIYAAVHLGLGEMDEALTAFEQSVQERSPNLAYIRLLPDIFSEELAAEARFRQVLKDVGVE
jgi:hypothetical protein